MASAMAASMSLGVERTLTARGLMTAILGAATLRASTLGVERMEIILTQSAVPERAPEYMGGRYGAAPLLKNISSLSSFQLLPRP
jgi:hypothetical protein